MPPLPLAEEGEGEGLAIGSHLEQTHKPTNLAQSQKRSSSAHVKRLRLADAISVATH
jgi:hypothetical protein